MREIACRKCGKITQAERSTKRYCDDCLMQHRRDHNREHIRRARAASPEAHREASRKWRAAHVEQARVRVSEWAKENREHKREYLKAWVAEHPERMRELNRNHYHANREKIRDRQHDYTERNRETLTIRQRERTQRRRAIIHDAPGIWTEAEFRTLCAAYDNHCAYCHRVADNLTPDHIIPLARGGDNAIDNIVPACISCNSAKQARTPLEFIASHGGFARMMGAL